MQETGMWNLNDVRNFINFLDEHYYLPHVFHAQMRIRPSGQN